MYYEKMPIQIYWKFYHQKMKKKSDKKILIFFIFLLKAAEIRKNNVYPCKPQFFYIKVGFKGVKIV